MSAEPTHYTSARRHLSRRDPILKKLIKQVGPCTLRTSTDRFAVLVRSIISQQISSKAAMSIGDRLTTLLGKRGIHPLAIDKVDDATLRSAGLSASKIRAIRDLTNKVLAGDIQLADIHEHDDEAVIEQLLPVFGIGRWTAEMFLIFALGRLDVLPLADLGLRVGMQRQLEMADIPTREHLIELAEAWRPYRTIGTWYIWRSFGPVPQS
jgi:DNA-3-methyladenine glycosylase II